MSTNHRTALVSFWVGLAVAAVVVGVTWPAAFRQLSLDDIPHLLDFPKANASRGFVEVFEFRHWQDQHSDAVWRPTSKLLWWGLGRAGMLGSVWLTGLTALLAGGCAALFVLCLQGRIGSRWLLVLAAAVPLLHPLSADVLLPYVGQTDLLAALGILGAWAALSRGGGVRLVCGGLFLALGFFSKESAWPGVLALPVVLWLGAGSRPRRLRAGLRSLALAVSVLGCHVLLRFALLGSFAKATGGLGTVYGVGERHVGVAETFGRYVWAFLFARTPQTDYSFLKQPGSSGGLYPWGGAAGAVAFGLALAWLLKKTPASRANAQRLRASRLAGGALLWIVLFLLPYLGFVSLGALWAGRFAFMSLFGFALLLVSCVRLVQERYRWVPVALLATILLSGVSGIFMRAYDWVSPAQLWEAEVRRVPEHSFAWKNHSVYLQRSGQLAKSYEAICRSTDLWPCFGEAWIGRAQAANALKRDAESEWAFSKAQALIPHSRELQLVLAQRAASRKNYEEAALRLRKLLSENPNYLAAQQLLERVLSEPEMRKGETASRRSN